MQSRLLGLVDCPIVSSQVIPIAIWVLKSVDSFQKVPGGTGANGA